VARGWPVARRAARAPEELASFHAASASSSERTTAVTTTTIEERTIGLSDNNAPCPVSAGRRWPFAFAPEPRGVPEISR
jgi:hypothetical protein